MFSVNIVLLSYRDTELAREIVALCCDLATKKLGVLFSLGFGGDNHLLELRYRKMIAATLERGGEGRILCCADAKQRWEFCLGTSKEWTLILSDDDVFSINYLRSLVDTTLCAQPTINRINPTSYLILNKNSNVLIVPSLSTDGCIRTRYKMLIDDPDPALSFYGVHRTDTLLNWFAYFDRKGRFPVYADQVLLTLETVTGMALRTAEPSFLAYDYSNWATFDLIIKKQAKEYDNQEMALFHELFWCIDVFNTLKSIGLSEELLFEHFEWWRAMIGQLIDNYQARKSILNLNKCCTSDAYFDKIKEYFQYFALIKYVNQANYLLNCFQDLEGEISLFFASQLGPVGQ